MKVQPPLASVRVFGKGRIVARQRPRLLLAAAQVFPQLGGEALFARKVRLFTHWQSRLR